MGPFIASQYPEGTKVWISTIDNTRIVGLIKGYNKRDGIVESLVVEVLDGPGKDNHIAIDANEISAIFDV